MYQLTILVRIIRLLHQNIWLVSLYTILALLVQIKNRKHNKTQKFARVGFFRKLGFSEPCRVRDRDVVRISISALTTLKNL